MIVRLFALACLCISVNAFIPLTPYRTSRWSPQHAAVSNEPIAVASGCSTNADLVTAIQDAVALAAESVAPNRGVDLAVVSVSSLYDAPGSTVVPAVLAATQVAGIPSINHIIGSTVAGCVGPSAQGVMEHEGIPAVSVTLAQLPDTELTTLHIEEIPEGRVSAEEWKRGAGLGSIPNQETTFFLLSSPAFSNSIDDMMFGLEMYFNATIMGGIASTVSSLSRAKLFRWSEGYDGTTTFGDGCVGVAMQGDIQVQSMTAQGTKPVGGIYQIVKGQESTVGVVVLDEQATDALDEDETQLEDDEEDDEEDEKLDAKAQAMKVYASARIPKPVLAEANFLMKTLSDDDQAFMRRQLLVGIEKRQPARTASELARLAAGEGHRFAVQQVASAGMKDGSVTLPLGSVEVSPGSRMRFFVREADFAKKELEALWLGYQKRLLESQFVSGNKKDKVKFSPAICWLIPTLDRGNKFFGGKPGFESSVSMKMLPTIPAVAGFFSNGVLTSGETVQGSASGYFLMGSKSGRPIYTPTENEKSEDSSGMEEEEEKPVADKARASKTVTETKAPRSPNGELILKRREVHSSRALTVSTVEWSVAERTAVPTSTLEGYMWDKETEVDRFRERVPLANLVSQCRLSAKDPRSLKPRDFISRIKPSEGEFVIIPELKQSDPTQGSLYKWYDIEKQSREFTTSSVRAIAINCDPVLFGGSLEDITKARSATSKAAVEDIAHEGVVVPPLLAMDLVLYPYQLYKLRLAGADAVNLVTGALEQKDLVYLTKIASSLQLQVWPMVTSEAQVSALTALPCDSYQGIILSNRELEDFSFDKSGEQALRLLRSEALAELKAKHEHVLVFVQGQVGAMDRDQASYLSELKKAGASGAFVGTGLATSDPVLSLSEMQALC